MWSEGVKQHEHDKLEHVDKAVISGIPRVSTQLINFEYDKKKKLYVFILGIRNPNCVWN